MTPIIRLNITSHIGKSLLIPISRRYIHLGNGPNRSDAAEQYDQSGERIKSFDDLPTRNANAWQSLFDILSIKRKGWLQRPDLMTQDNADRYGSLMRNYLGNEMTVQVTDPKLVEKVLRSDGKYPERISIAPWKEYRVSRNIPLGLFLHDGKPWHRNRQAIGKHLLRPMEMAQYIPAMLKITNDTISRLKQIRESTEERKDIIPHLEEELFKWSMEGAVQVLLDERLGLLSDNIDKQSQSFIDAIQEVFNTTLDLFLFGNVHKRFNTKTWRRHVAGWDTTIDVTRKLIEHRVEELMSLKEKDIEVKTDTFLGALISKSDLTREEIFGNLSELIGAAIDTTSYSLVWTLYLLAHNQSTQSKLRKEINDALPVGKTVNQEDLSKLVYMKQVIKESMRMIPVVNGLTRKLDDDIILNGYRIPAKTTIIIQFYPMSKDPNCFKDPLEFRPERWERVGNTFKDGGVHEAFASLPFGFGTRMCVGRRFAEQEMHLLLSEIIRQFDIVPTKTVEITSKILVVPAEPVDLKFIDRI